MQNTLVNVNGQIFKPEEARVAIFDRGFLYGDSLYEVVRTYGGKFLHLEQHLERLETSAALCRMILAQPRARLREEMTRALEAYYSLQDRKGSEAYCRIIVTRGTGKIGFGISCLTSASQYFVIVQPLEPPTPEQFARGASLQVSGRLRNDRRALDPAMKSGNYLNSLLAFLDASERGYDDAILCDGQGFITEGTTFNVFYARNGIVATPPLDVGILDGITRRHVIDLAGKLGIPVREVRFPRERLQEADEVFLTSTIKEVFPVTRLDGKSIGNGKPGPLTRKLGEAFRERIPVWMASERPSS